MMFAYQSGVAPDIVTKECRTEDGVTHEDLSYESQNGDRVTATLLSAPPAGEPRAGLLMLHWGFGDRRSFLSEGAAYARAGALVLLIDAPSMGDRGRGLPRLDRADVASRYMIQSVTDLRRGVDVLLARGALSGRIGYVGHSLGATVGVPFVGVDGRIAAAVLMAGAGDVSRGVWSLQPDSAYAATMSPLDGVNFIRQAPTDLFLQFATRDAFIDHATAGRLIAAAPQARTAWYEADHSFCRKALTDRAAWLCERLALRPPRPDWLDAVRLPARDLWRHRLNAPVYRLAKRLFSA